MSVCGQLEEESASEEPGAPLREAYEEKSVSKVVRVLTVLAYLLSVSLAAILLSVYYVCVWKSPELPALNSTGEGPAPPPVARRADPPFPTRPNATDPPFHNVDGRGSIAVNETSRTTEPATVASETTDSGPTSPELPLLAGDPLSLPDNRTGVRADNSSVT